MCSLTSRGNQQEWDHSAVAIPVILEIVVGAHFSAINRVLGAHFFFDEGVAALTHALTARPPSLSTMSSVFHISRGS